MITNEIGLNAGKVWNFLNEKGEHPVKEIAKKLKISSNDFYMAVGWLAREGKVIHFDKEGVLVISLN